jgi:hypothetical protein
MNISGTTNTCLILTNTPFILSGLSQTNISTVNITDLNGLDVSQCYGITTNIITVNGDNVIHSGICDTSLEITITSGVTNPVECLYTGYTQQDDGLVLFHFTGNTTSLNIHPDCCTGLGYTPEIGVDHYYVCRWGELCDPLDCDNYTSTNQFDINDYVIFEDDCNGGTTTIVPSEQCCIDNGFIGLLTFQGIRCITDAPPPPPCGDLILNGIPPISGDIEWMNTVTGNITYEVPTAECCSLNGFLSRPNRDGFICYISPNDEELTIEINDEGNYDNCVTAKCFTIRVPDGSSATVSISKNGIAPYANIVPNEITCNINTHVFSDLVETITTDKTYYVGVEGRDNTGEENTETTIINVFANDGENTVQTQIIRQTPPNIVNC